MSLSTLEAGAGAEGVDFVGELRCREHADRSEPGDAGEMDSKEKAVVDDTAENGGSGVACCDDDASSVGEKRNVYAVAACLITATVGVRVCNEACNNDVAMVAVVEEASRRLSD